ncbi:iron complex transport system substrate-binding protein [Paraburkholderia bannensis]|uniref:Iron complex transport system substrate-binding protein n=1 Tax=Paraburkholderia bannensis TaxID=765414 RepID=A0A7W9WS40_9BURK|nr:MULTISPECIES: iron-siderophore ABC transporter substrate-binding protein [Paraburkholderia]MBB3256952.1 iron complex transport system substrate-binding protein [Paraburkholderia sp. WP4_3_2]MBB6101906.1 iron complex transport system substrate-binding protein [Paraburkholderia bannensis]
MTMTTDMTTTTGTTHAMNNTRRRLLAASLALPLVACMRSNAIVPTPLGASSPTLPTDARRIVSLEFVFTESLLGLGRAPTGAADPDVYRRWVGIDADALRDTVSVGTRQQPDLAAIAALKPDLIVGYAQRHARIAGRLASIAPTVIYDLEPPPGEDDAYTRLLRVYDDLASRVGAQQAAGALRAKLDQAIAATRAQVQAHGLSHRPTALMSPLAGDSGFWGFDRRSSVGALLDHVGLSNAWSTTSVRRMGVRLGFDALYDHPDWMLLLLDKPDQPLYAQRLWRGLPSVQAGRIGYLPRATWTFGGPVAMTTFVERVGAALPTLEPNKVRAAG